jgi:hypothetical protein
MTAFTGEDTGPDLSTAGVDHLIPLRVPELVAAQIRAALPPS